MKSHFSLLMVALVVLLTFEPAGADSKTFPADSSPFPCQSPGIFFVPHPARGKNASRWFDALSHLPSPSGFNQAWCHLAEVFPIFQKYYAQVAFSGKSGQKPLKTAVAQRSGPFFAAHTRSVSGVVAEFRYATLIANSDSAALRYTNRYDSILGLSTRKHHV
ncbi:uncharacterized protein PGTG_15624 [Puccinia graminis f. sp. tritici CRL 75-36-700-3]|uniref:Uncharacterized protein n=1 Tax=Puccinia graminis f. sp. tritici (strain CRL 75-36-700-3 / race SCCL) TaxID=418459 RepID=E3KZD6_PUCGT|nr:uncharacterized protein PGTG_15624 [Puccinia graminis f. sp. tritici CRL 75-36-700-3]EFP89661.1 hypothetical protein PGTG_15624 [Puccinia graminis f. sp. tritici CRL 75-36-700-3]